MNESSLHQFGNTKQRIRDALKIDHQHFIDSVNHSKAIYEKDLQINSCSFPSLQLAEMRIRGSLGFRDCRLKGRLDFREVTVDGQISFINCIFEGPVIFFGLEVHGSLQFHECTANSKIEIRNSAFGRLDIERACDLDNLVMEGDERSFAINAIRISASTIRKKLIFSRLTVASAFEFKDSSANELWLRNVDINDLGHLIVSDSSIERVEINGGKMHGIKAEFFRSSFARFFSFKPDVLDGAKVDLSSSSFEDIELKEDCYSVVRSTKDRPILFSDDQHNYRQRIDTLRLLNKSFQSQLRYDLQDACLFLLKDYEARERITCAPTFFGKVWSRTTHFFGRNFLGWGVSLKRIFEGYLVIYLVFILVYFLCVAHNDLVEVTIVDLKIKGTVLAAISLATVNQVGLFADTHVHGAVYSAIGIFQHTLSILYITLLTGVVIRKLVR